MQLDRKYIHEIYNQEQNFYDGYESFCFQNCLRILLESKGFRSAALYINSSLSLIYDENEDVCKFRTHENVRGLLPSLNDYVKRYYYDSPNKEEIFYENIKYMFTHNEPIIVGVDTYYLPYAINYMKNHAVHTLILAGYDLDRNEVNLIDWYEPWLFKGTIDIDIFLQARNSENPYDGTVFSGVPIQNNWAYIEKFDQKETRKLFKEVIQYTMKQYYVDYDNVGPQALCKMYNYFKSCKSESGYIGIYKDIYTGIKRHKLFLLYLSIYLTIEDIKLLANAIELLKEVVKKWDIMLMLLMKQAKNPTERTKTRALNKFQEIIEDESKLYTCINQINDFLNTTELEKEVKILLNKQEYERLNNVFLWNDKFQQINYYYLDREKMLQKNNITVRVRKKRDTYKLQIKIPVKIERELHIKSEYEEDVDNDLSFIPANKIEKVCNISVGDASKIGELVTERQVCQWNDDIKICLDRNTFLGMEDYELEIEYTNRLDKQIIDKIKQCNISVGNSTKGKYGRFSERYFSIKSEEELG